MYFVATFVFLLVGAGVRVSAQAPTPCCAPHQFTLRYDQVVTSQSGSSGPMGIAGEGVEAAYDFINAMVGMDVVVRPVNKTEQKLKIIQNFTAGYEWVIEGTHCVKRQLSLSHPSRCIPAGATFEGTFTIGLERLRVNTWLIDASHFGPIHGYQRYTVTEFMCTPFSSIFLGTDTATNPPTHFVNAGSYMDFEDRIHDWGRWFHLPPFCQNATSMPLSSERSQYVRFF